MRDLGHPGSKSAAEIGVVAGDPVFAGWGEDVEVDGVFEGEDFVGDVGRDDEDFIGIEDGFGGSICAGVVQEESELTGEEAGYLLVVMMVQRDVGAFAEGDAGDHDVDAGDELAA
jgi:hypothetical protein